MESKYLCSVLSPSSYFITPISAKAYVFHHFGTCNLLDTIHGSLQISLPRVSQKALHKLIFIMVFGTRYETHLHPHPTEHSQGGHLQELLLTPLLWNNQALTLNPPC